MSSQAAYAGNFGQIHAEDAVEVTPQIKAEFVSPRLVAVLGLGQRLLIIHEVAGKRLQLPLDLAITNGDPLLILAIGFEGLPESE